MAAFDSELSVDTDSIEVMGTECKIVTEGLDRKCISHDHIQNYGRSH